MNQYECPFCKRMVFYDDDHPCFNYMMEDITISLQRQEELDEEGKTRTDAKDGLMKNSNEISEGLCSNMLQNESGKSEHMHLLPIENKEKLSLTPASNCGSKIQIKGCGVSMEERKCLSLNRDKKNFLDALVPAIENACSNNTNISRTGSLINSDVLLLNEEQNNEMIGPLGDPREDNVPTEVPPQVQIISKEMAVNEDEPIYSNKKDDAVAGPPRKCSSKKNHVCDICLKKFKLKSELHKHKRIHTGEKPFVYDICGKEFTQKGNRDTHLRTHTGEKPFVCNVCRIAFAHKSTLTGHIRTHTEEKPYKCPVCDKVFANLSNCYRHQRREHK